MQKSDWHKQWMDETLEMCESHYERAGITLTQEEVEDIFSSLSQFAEILVKRELSIKKRIKKAEKIKDVEKVKNDKLLTVQELAKYYKQHYRLKS